MRIITIALDSNLCIAIAPPTAFTESKAEPLFEKTFAIHCLGNEVGERRPQLLGTL